MSTGPEPAVLHSEELFRGRVIALRRDAVALPDGSEVVREVVVHPGAVGVVALDAEGRVALIEQYRHPVGQRLWELPAGLLDIAGEPAQVGAARELIEEAGLAADTWHVLVDALTSPGMTDEAIRIYLARDLHDVPRPPGEAEEAGIALEWVPLFDAVDRVMAGTIRNASAIAGILATAVAVQTEYEDLRPVTAPWADRRVTPA